MAGLESQFVYVRHDNGVHQLIFVKATNDALDMCLAQMGEIYDAHPMDEVLMFLFDLRPDGLPPLRYMMRASQQFFAKRPVVPETRAAYIYKSNVLASLGQTLLDFLSLRTERHFFTSDQEAEAIAWLLERPES